jgi:hypothetical protein
VFLREELGDKPELYDTMLISHPVFRTTMHALKHKENGDCIYLGDNGCTIWDRAPAVCQMFDCRTLYMATTRKQRKKFVKQGLFSHEVMKAGKRLSNV